MASDTRYLRRSSGGNQRGQKDVHAGHGGVPVLDGLAMLPVLRRRGGRSEPEGFAARGVVQVSDERAPFLATATSPATTVTDLTPRPPDAP